MTEDSPTTPSEEADTCTVCGTTLVPGEPCLGCVDASVQEIRASSKIDWGELASNTWGYLVLAVIAFLIVKSCFFDSNGSSSVDRAPSPLEVDVYSMTAMVASPGELEIEVTGGERPHQLTFVGGVLQLSQHPFGARRWVLQIWRFDICTDGHHACLKIDLKGHRAHRVGHLDNSLKNARLGQQPARLGKSPAPVEPLRIDGIYITS